MRVFYRSRIFVAFLWDKHKWFNKIGFLVIYWTKWYYLQYFDVLVTNQFFFLKFLSVWKISNFMFVFEKTANICSKSTWITISNSSNALFCFALRCVFRRTFLKCKSFYDRRVAPSCLCCVSFHLIPLNNRFLFYSKWKLNSTSNCEPYPLDFIPIERDLMTSVKGVIKKAITISQTVPLSILTCLQSIINLNCLF